MYQTIMYAYYMFVNHSLQIIKKQEDYFCDNFSDYHNNETYKEYFDDGCSDTE